MAAKQRRRASPAPPRPQDPPKTPERARVRWLLWPALLLVTAAAYRPAWYGGLLWDDAAHITAAHLRDLTGLWRIWFDVGATQQYYPVVHSAFWLAHRAWGDQTLPYHLLNIGLHATSAFVLALLLWRLAIPGAAVAAVVFALHPVHVESVAWISELKNTLSGLFYLLAAACYLRYDETRRASHYIRALGLFVIAVLTKTVTATLPGALLVVLWWQRGRLRREDVRPLVPFLVLGLLAGLMTAWVERTYVGAEGADYHLSFVERVLLAGRAVWFYAATLAWPADLIFIYPRWTISAGRWWQYLFPLAAAAVVGMLWRMRTRTRGPLAAALLFGGTLLPALGFVNVFPFRYSFVADHFQYLASLAPIALVSALAVTALARIGVPAGARQPVLIAALAIPLGLLTSHYSRDYRDEETLYRVTLQRNPACWLCHTNLAVMLRGDPARVEEALAFANSALSLRPDDSRAHNNAGVLLQAAGRLDAALAHYQTAARLDPAYAEAHNNAGGLLQAVGRMDEAIVHIEQAVRLDPQNASTHDNLGTALSRAGRFEEALPHYRTAIRIDPAFVSARNNLATALAAMGRLGEAIAEYEEALGAAPRDARTHDNFAFALADAGQRSRAQRHAEEALRIDPDYAPARITLATLLLQSGRAQEAIPHLERALARPQLVDPATVHTLLGSAYLHTADRTAAIRHFEEALRIRPGLEEARAGLARVRRP